jgi:hypothetical protein
MLNDPDDNSYGEAELTPTALLVTSRSASKDIPPLFSTAL